MRAEKDFINQEYVKWLNGAPFFIVVEYRGLNVGHFSELRKRLAKAGAEIHVIKNSIFRISAKQLGLADLSSLGGQLGVVTGLRDVSTTAKVLKTFHAEFDKPKIRFGYLNNKRLETLDLMALAELPSLEILRGKICGLINAPAARLVRMLNTPGTQMVRALQARVDKGN